MTADPHYFTEEALKEWTRLGAKHRIRDERFLCTLETYLRPGPVLELGAATGHLSEILHRRGYDVTASDVSPRFVAAAASRGLRSAIVDATCDIRAQTGRGYANVLAQNVLPLIWRDRATLLKTLAVIHAALEPGGRFISISAHARRAPNPDSYFSPREQVEITVSTDLFRVVAEFPHQAVPTALYRAWNAGFLNFLDFQLAKIAAVRQVCVMERN